MIIPKGTVVTIDGKVYRTLEAQVAWNKEELESLDIESLEALPDQFTELQENVSALSEHVDDVAEDVGTLQGDVSDLDNTINGDPDDPADSGLVGEVGDLQTDMTQAQFDISQAQGDITALGMSKQDKYLAMSVELPSTDWVIDNVSGFNITVNVSGVTSSNLVQVTPGVSTISDYLDAGVYCSAQGNGTLTFHSDSTQHPSVNLFANVVIWR